jgi:hypothetical protein
MDGSKVSRRGLIAGAGALAGAGLMADRANAALPAGLASAVPATTGALPAVATRPQILSIFSRSIAGSEFQVGSSAVAWTRTAGGLTVAGATSVFAGVHPSGGDVLSGLTVAVDPAGAAVTYRLLEVSRTGVARALATGTIAASTGATTSSAFTAATEYADPESYSYVVQLDVGAGATVYGADVTVFSATSSFVFIDPVRVWDSRTVQGAVTVPGATAGGRLVSGQDLGFTLDLIIPRFARGPLLNVTLDQTIGSGYLVFYPSPEDDEAPPPISNINWYGPNQIVANLVVTTMAGEADVAVHVGGGGSTHMIVDVLGYFV